MTQEQLKQLRELIEHWVSESWSTGNAAYAFGYDSGRASAADDLEKLLDDWQAGATLEPLDPM